MKKFLYPYDEEFPKELKNKIIKIENFINLKLKTNSYEIYYSVDFNSINITINLCDFSCNITFKYYELLSMNINEISNIIIGNINCYIQHKYFKEVYS